jgi:acetyl esterase/lipase
MTNLSSEQGRLLDVTRDVLWTDVAGIPLRLDLAKPAAPGPLPSLVVYIHGGAWQFGDRTTDFESRVLPLAARGMAVASIDYRVGVDGRWPAALHDVRGAIRWLRRHGDELGVSTGRIGLWGSSAGAHLALAVALATAPELEGAVGGNTGVSSAVQAVVNFFGVADFAATSARSPMERLLLPASIEAPFLGLTGGPEDAQLLAAASPSAFVRTGAPPILHVHGDRDQLLSNAVTQRLHDSLVQVGSPSMLLTIGGAGHEDPAFDTPFVLGAVAAFLDQHLSAVD